MDRIVGAIDEIRRSLSKSPQKPPQPVASTSGSSKKSKETLKGKVTSWIDDKLRPKTGKSNEPQSSSTFYFDAEKPKSGSSSENSDAPEQDPLAAVETSPRKKRTRRVMPPRGCKMKPQPAEVKKDILLADAKRGRTAGYREKRKKGAAGDSDGSANVKFAIPSSVSPSQPESSNASTVGEPLSYEPPLQKAVYSLLSDSSSSGSRRLRPRIRIAQETDTSDDGLISASSVDPGSTPASSNVPSTVPSTRDPTPAREIEEAEKMDTTNEDVEEKVEDEEDEVTFDGKKRKRRRKKKVVKKKAVAKAE